MLDIKIRNQIIAAMRKLSRWYPPRNAAKLKCKVEDTIYRCSKCGVLMYDGKSKKNYAKFVEKYAPDKVIFEPIQMDHISPVVDPKVGYVDLQVYAERLFVPEEYWRGLCNFCHKGKSKKEAKVRADTRAKKKLE